jgi:hypothetical protein
VLPQMWYGRTWRHLLLAAFMLGLLLDTQYVPLKRRWTYNKLNGIKSQKTARYIVKAVRSGFVIVAERVYLRTGCVAAGSNISILAPQVVGREELEPSAWGYNQTTPFLGDISTGTWPSRLGESRI